MILAVNGTLMRGLELNARMLEAGGKFISEARTADLYRLWSVHDQYPGMVRVDQGGASIEIELWELSGEGVAQLVAAEPEGLCLGKILLDTGQTVPGILAESYILAGCQEITHFGGWRKFIQLPRG
jgi:gamma-glutamylcyclotransferase (GGCT)/AIG2-like uncharacterized protein YtfP